jgi:Tol biopolymer transport system component
MSVARTSERGNVRKEVLGSMVCAKLLKVMVAVLTVLSLVTLVPAQQVGRPSVQGLPNGVTRGGLSIALAKLERKGDEVRVWIAFRKVGHASGGADFLLNIRDDRGNIYPPSPFVESLSVPPPGFASPLLDLDLLPVGFTWVRSATVGMPAKAPIQSILVYSTNLGTNLGPDGVSLDPLSAKWPTIDLEVVRKNDIVGKKFKLSRDITVWFGQPAQQEEGRGFRWRIPVFIQNEDYNPRRVPMDYINYFLYFPSGEIIPTPLGVEWISQVDIGSGIPAMTTIEVKHVTSFITPFTDEPVAIMVDMGTYNPREGRRVFGFLPLEGLRRGAAGTTAPREQGSAAAWTLHEFESRAPTSLHDITYGNGLFVAVSSMGVGFISTDGKKWRQVEFDKRVESITYGKGMFVAVGEAILTSTNGHTWTTVEQTSRWKWQLDVGYLNGVTYGNGLFVGVGSSGTIVTSSDGKNWTKFKTKADLYDVTYGNGFFVAVGNSAIVTSVNGKDWTYQPLEKVGRIRGVAYGNGLFVAVGDAGMILTSSDGKNWTQTKQVLGVLGGPLNDVPQLNDVAYANGLFVAVGNYGTILTSMDGWNWRKQVSGTSGDLKGVTYGNGLFVVVGWSTSLNPLIMTSSVEKTPATGVREPASGQEAGTMRERLPVKVGDKVVFVVPVAELPSDLQERLKGKAAIAVVDEQGKIPKDKVVIFKALVAWHVARNLLDSPEPGWDVNNAKKWANSFEDQADKLERILVQQGIADLLTEAGNLGARWLVIGGLAGAGLPISVPRAAIKAAVDQFLLNPKNAVRALLSADLAVAEKQMRKAAALLRSIQGYPLDSDVALRLFEVDALDAPLGSEAVLARLRIAGSVPDQLVEPVKAALGEFLSLLREASDPKVSFGGEYATVALKFFRLVRQVEGWDAYEHERQRIVNSWSELVRGYVEMTKAIYSVAETAEVIGQEPQSLTLSSSAKREEGTQAFAEGQEAKPLAKPLIAFVRANKPLYYPDAKSDIWTVRADGTDLKQLTTSGRCAYPSWTPDGRQIVFIANNQVWIMNADGTGKRQLTQLKGWKCAWPTVSPDGKKILFTASREVSEGEEIETVRLMNIDGSGLQTLLSERTEDYTAFSAPTFSPDGSSILYVEHGSGTGEASLNLFSLRDKRKQILYGNGKQKSFYDCYNPAFSPDGKQIACVAACWVEKDGMLNTKRSGIVVMNRDGSQPRLIFVCPVEWNLSSSRPVWSADGQELVFATEEGLWILDLKTRQKRMVLRMEGVMMPAWQSVHSAAESTTPSVKSESQTLPQGAFQAKLLWQRKFKDFPIWHIAISPDGRFLAVAGGSEYLIDKEGGVHLVRATDGALLKFFSLGKGNYASWVAFSPDGKLLAVTKGHHEVSLWRVDSGSLVRKKVSQKDLESFLSIGRSNVSPDGKLVAEVEDVVIEDAPECGGLSKVQQKMVVRWVKDGRVAWDFATKFQCESPDTPTSSCSAAVFSPDGRLLALAGRDGIIRIWSVKDRQLVGTLKMPAVYSLAFSKDGKLLAAGALTNPGEVRLWRVKEK